VGGGYGRRPGRGGGGGGRGEGWESGRNGEWARKKGGGRWGAWHVEIGDTRGVGERIVGGGGREVGPEVGNGR